MNITLQVWARPLASNTVAAVAFNRGSFPARLNLTWAMIGAKSGHSDRVGATAQRHVRDLWKHQDMGSFVGGYEVLVEPHDVVMVVVMKSDDEEGSTTRETVQRPAWDVSHLIWPVAEDFASQLPELQVPERAGRNCIIDDFPHDLADLKVNGLKPQPHIKSVDDCRAACCKQGDTCQVYEWTGDPSYKAACWTGRYTQSTSGPGYISRARGSITPPPAPPPAPPAFPSGEAHVLGDSKGLGLRWEGVGAVSGRGASSKLIMDYDPDAGTIRQTSAQAGDCSCPGARRRAPLKSDEGSRSGKRVLWWVNSGSGPAAGPTNAEFVARHRHAMTGLVPGFGCWGMSVPKNGTGIALSVDELCGPKYFSGEAHGTMAGLDIFPVGRPDLPAVLGVSAAALSLSGCVVLV
jgi:hypothetical protein